MANFFSGWIGYGLSMQAGLLQEPTDTAYTRRPIVFSMLENGMTFDIRGGTVGPASTAWGLLAQGGLFDAPTGGNLLLFFSLIVPVPIGLGATYTTGPGSNVMFGRDLKNPSETRIFPAGTVIGVTPDGRPLTANLPLQVSGGILAAQTVTFGATVTMSTLPSQAPATGTGQLWNNGGIVALS